MDLLRKYCSRTWLLVCEQPLTVAWLEETRSGERYPSQGLLPGAVLASSRQLRAKMVSRGGEEAFVRSLAKLLRDEGDGVLGGASTLSLLTLGLQLLQQLFQRHLLARQDQRGFVALPSHPSDTITVLQLQFLFDVLQKTVSLKLVHPPGPTLQTPVHIFAFKSLKYLQLKRIPPHCLEGLRGVYTQLEILVCTHCINTIEEVVSVCGGDLSSALPWPDLHTLNFSHNHIAGLDSSLALLNVLRTLDLSHNHLRDCEEHLKPLSELEYVNLSYNLLQQVPVFSSSARVKLVTLLLRSNQLDNINGVEYLCHLQHLDLAYNLISEHAQLAPLSQLHRLKELYLAGNPVFYQRDHRPSTIHHLSPKAAFMRLVLDTEPLTLVELTYLPRSGQLIGQTLHHSSRGSSLKNVLEAPLTDGRWSPDISGKLSRKKNKIKVRSASISDPSDSEVDLRHQPISSSLVLPHQEEIERLDALRGQVGDDWLRYQHHLKAPEEEGEVSGGGDSSVSLILGSPSLGGGSEGEGWNGEAMLNSPADTVMEPSEGADTSTSYMPASASPPTPTSGDSSPTDSPRPQEEETITDVCQPFIVSRAVKEGESEGPWLFLRVTEEELLEVELMTADVLERLELSSLTAVRASHQPCQGGDGQLPAVDCQFSYICKDKRRRKYVIMDKSPKEAAQLLLELLNAALARNLRAEQVEPPQQQCLKCRHEFPAQPPSQPPTQLSNADHISFLAAELPGKATCPRCGSDHVVVLPARNLGTERRTSTPLPTDQQPSSLPTSNPFHPDQQPPFLDSDTPRSSSKSDTEAGGSLEPQTSIPDNSSSFVTAKSGSFYLEGGLSGGEGSDRELDMSSRRGRTLECSPPHPHSHPHRGRSHKGSFNSTGGSLTWSYRYSNSLTPTPGSPLSEYGEDPASHVRGGEFNLNVEDFQTIDHRLKLFFDVEVFDADKEEHQCFIQAGAVKTGCPVEFPCLLVVSNINIYILEVTGPIRGQPTAWLRRREAHALVELVCVQVGLRTQSIGLQFEDGGGAGAAYTLLIRNPAKCRSFIQFFTDVVRELTPRTVSKLRSISFTRMDPRHQLWPLVCERSTTESLEGKRPNYLYVLAFLRQDGRSVPVTVVATPSTLHLLEENHEWQPSREGEGGSPGPPQLPLIDTQPICNISSICLYQSSPQHLLIRVYHEVTRMESVWGLHTECVELVRELVEWLRAPWEEMFGVPLRVTVQPELDWPEV